MTAPTASPSTAVATVKPKALTIAELIDAAAPTLEPLLLSGNTLERVKAEVFFAARKEPKIALCTPSSLVRAVATCVQRDLIIGETIHLVPMQESYKDSAGKWQKRYVLSAWNDWKGDIELVVRAGVAQSVKVMAVFAEEPFEYREGLEPFLEHHPSKDTATRGALIGAYAVARVKHGHYIVVWMPLGDIEDIRAKSQSWGPEKVKTCPPWYARKTVVHQICKRLPKNPKLRGLLAMQSDDPEIPDGEVTAVGEAPALPSGHPAKLLQHGDDAYSEHPGEEFGGNGSDEPTGATLDGVPLSESARTAADEAFELRLAKDDAR